MFCLTVLASTACRKFCVVFWGGGLIGLRGLSVLKVPRDGNVGCLEVAADWVLRDGERKLAEPSAARFAKLLAVLRDESVDFLGGRSGRFSETSLEFE